MPSILFYYCHREAQEQAELAKLRAERPKIQQHFADLKRALSGLTEAEWDIPEVGNLTRKKRRREERSYVVPDSVLVGGRSTTEYENALDPRQQEVRYVHSPISNRLTFFRLTEWRFRNTSRVWHTDQLCGNWTSS